jgi:hypothetical protein
MDVERSPGLLRSILEDMYLEGWSPGDPGLEKAMIRVFQERGNPMPDMQERSSVALLQQQFAEFCSSHR